MGKTSSAVTRRYKQKTYDRIIFEARKGMKDDFKAACIKSGDSMAGILTKAMREHIDANK